MDPGGQAHSLTHVQVPEALGQRHLLPLLPGVGVGTDWNIPASWEWMCVIGVPFGLVRVCLLLHRQAQPQTSLKRSSAKGVLSPLLTSLLHPEPEVLAVLSLHITNTKRTAHDLHQISHVWLNMTFPFPLISISWAVNFTAPLNLLSHFCH